MAGSIQASTPWRCWTSFLVRCSHSSRPSWIAIISGISTPPVSSATRAGRSLQTTGETPSSSTPAPSPSSPSPTSFLPRVPEDGLYVMTRSPDHSIKNGCFEVLNYSSSCDDFREMTPYWVSLPPPPFASCMHVNITSYTVVRGTTIYISCKKPVQATYVFDTVSHKWHQLGSWTMCHSMAELSMCRSSTSSSACLLATLIAYVLLISSLTTHPAQQSHPRCSILGWTLTYLHPGCPGTFISSTWAVASFASPRCSVLLRLTADLYLVPPLTMTQLTLTQFI